MNNFINQIFNADCIYLMKQLEPNIIDLTVTSPPYDNLKDYQGFYFNCEETAVELFHITKEGGVVV